MTCHLFPNHPQCAIARLAQSAERKALNLVVVGSSPTVGAFSPMCICCFTLELHEELGGRATGTLHTYQNFLTVNYYVRGQDDLLEVSWWLHQLLHGHPRSTYICITLMLLDVNRYLVTSCFILQLALTPGELQKYSNS
jgi:hypothetical protein